LRLELDRRAEREPAVRQALEAEQGSIIDAILLDLGFGQIDAFDADVDVIRQIISDAAIQLASRGRNNREAEGTGKGGGTSRVERAECAPPRVSRSG